ncbi:unnamed protein product [Clavelina lepadiformis]|uniref:Uncharacterized protein n=1 Tax=Clavelina lepadiformis TaxID=159417 RepID=A0ABP0GLS2_CLALP
MDTEPIQTGENQSVAWVVENNHLQSNCSKTQNNLPAVETTNSFVFPCVPSKNKYVLEENIKPRICAISSPYSCPCNPVESNFETLSQGCSSPESGFGSEHQYSPYNVQNHSTDTTYHENKEKHKDINEENFNTPPREDLQIICVKSLALSSKLEIPNASAASVLNRRTDETKPEVSVTIETPLENCKRLCIRVQGGKRVLNLNSNFIVDKSKSEEIYKNHASFTNLQGLTVPFSGLPALVHRHVLLSLSHHAAKTFVLDLLSADTENISSYPEKPLVSTIPSLTKPTNTAGAEAVRKSSRLRRCKTEPNFVSKISVKVASKEIDTSGSKSLDVISPDAIAADNVIATKRCRFSSSTTTSTTTCTENVQLVPKSPNEKLDRIKRLKEILRKREEDLEKMRKNCGFIS